MKKLVTAFCVTFSLIGGGATAAVSPPSPKPVATYGGVEVTRADVEAELQRFSPQERETFERSAASRTNLARELLLRRVVAGMARAQGLDQHPLHQQRLQLLEERLLYDAYMNARENATLDAAAIEALARDEYRVSRDRFVLPEEVRAAHVLIAVTESRTEAEARELAGIIRARALTGQAFDELAREYSDDPGSGQRGGDLGFFARGRMVPPFDDAVFALTEPGAVSEVVQTQFGFHVIRLTERREAGLREFDEVREELTASVRNRLRRQVRLDVVEPIRSADDFRIDAEALDAVFADDGR